MSMFKRLSQFALFTAMSLSFSYASLANEVVIYTNADEEAQVAIREALDNNGFKGEYLMQSMGTSELGGKMMAEGNKIEADLITLSSHYIESVEKKHHTFLDLSFEHKGADGKEVSYYAPLLGLISSIIVNTEVLKEDGLTPPKSIADLAKPQYEGHIAIPDINGSSTAWLMTLALIQSYGYDKGIELARQIEKNAGDHLSLSGSGPLKLLRSGEVAIGFGIRHQAVNDKEQGLPIDYIDPTEGNFMLTESVAVIDKGEKTNPNAMKMAEVIIKKARPALINNYPAVLYPNETIDAKHKVAKIATFNEPLTIELLTKHQQAVKADK